MKTHEIFELASLDALGLLDEREREAFERAFRAAPPSVQAQVRREQARVANDDSLLPRVDAPAGLRARVLSAVKRAVASGAERESMPYLRPSRGVNSIWRAAAVGCAAASIVFAFTTLQMKGEYDRLAKAQYSNEVLHELAAEFGASFPDTLSDHNTRFVQFAPDEGALRSGLFRGKAVIVVNPDGQSARLFGTNFDANADYALVVVGEDGGVNRVLRFAPSGASVVEELSAEAIGSIDLDSPGASTLSVTKTDSNGDTTVLRGEVLRAEHE